MKTIVLNVWYAFTLKTVEESYILTLYIHVFQCSGYFSRIQSVGAVREVSEVRCSGFDLLIQIMKIMDIDIPLSTSKNLKGSFTFHQNQFLIRLVGSERNV